MPEIAANTVEAVLSEWPLGENATFAAGDAIATVETEKAVVDVPAETDGVLLRTLVEPGKSVSVGTPLAVLGAPGEAVDDLDGLVQQLTGEAKPEAINDTAADEPSPAGTREVSQGAVPASETSPAGGPGEQAQGSGGLTNGAAGNVTALGGEHARIFASPLARRIAKENGLAIGDIDGTGPGGRIVRDDVRRALAGRISPHRAEANGQPGPDTPSPEQTGVDRGSAATAGVDRGSAAPPGVDRGSAAAPGAVRGSAATSGADDPPELVLPGATVNRADGTGPSTGYQDVPHSRMRRAIAARLAESNREAPAFAIRGSARVDRLLALRKELNELASRTELNEAARRKELNEVAPVKISVNELVVAAAARAHVAVPEMNVIWTPEAVRRFEDVDIAVAVATDRGLVTPVVRGVQRLTVSGRAGASADLVSRARDGRLRQDELEGGTLTVTNLGGFGTEDFTAVINPPQAAILAVGAARQEAVVADGEIGIATVLRVTLSVDHRPVDGATGARWMAAFLALLEAPLRILV
jgi:pyruvate dehydrogenase E2 component (dihydrolipoamide acetyltransferase)